MVITACGWDSVVCTSQTREQVSGKPGVSQICPGLASPHTPSSFRFAPSPPITPGPTALEFLPHWVSGQGSLPLAALTVVVTVGRAPAVWAGLLTLSLIALSCPSACGCSV